MTGRRRHGTQAQRRAQWTTMATARPVARLQRLAAAGIPTISFMAQSLLDELARSQFTKFKRWGWTEQP